MTYTGKHPSKDVTRQGSVLSTSERPRKKAKILLDDDSDDGTSESRGISVEEGKPSGDHILGVNQEYAQRFEHNKKREELQRLEEKYGTDFKREERGIGGDTSDASTDSTDSEAEDDDGILVSEELDAQIRATLQAIRRKDPRVYDVKTRFYSDLDNEQEEKTTIYKAQTKPMYLRDYHRENLLKGDLGTGIEDEQPLTYAQQQDDLRQTVIKEMHSVAHGLGPSSTGGDHADGDEDFLVRKEPKMDTQKSETNGGNMKFDPWAAEKDPETFLSSFMSTRAWVGIDGSKMQPFESDDEEDPGRRGSSLCGRSGGGCGRCRRTPRSG